MQTVSFVPRKEFSSSCKLSPKETVCIKRHFFIFRILLEFIPNMLSVKNLFLIICT